MKPLTLLKRGAGQALRLYFDKVFCWLEKEWVIPGKKGSMFVHDGKSLLWTIHNLYASAEKEHEISLE